MCLSNFLELRQRCTIAVLLFDVILLLFEGNGPFTIVALAKIVEIVRLRGDVD